MHRWIDHTAELEVELTAPTAEAVFGEAVVAIAELLGGGTGAGAGTRTVEVEASDRAALLAAFVEELVFLAESDRLIATAARAVTLGDGRVRAEVEFEEGDPPHLVKAVTYHRLAFEQGEGGYHATAVLDV